MSISKSGGGDEFQFDDLFPSGSVDATKLEEEDEVLDVDSDAEDFEEGHETELSEVLESDPDEAAAKTSVLKQSIPIKEHISVSAFTLRRLVGKGAYGKVNLLLDSYSFEWNYIFYLGASSRKERHSGDLRHEGAQKEVPYKEGCGGQHCC